MEGPSQEEASLLGKRRRDDGESPVDHQGSSSKRERSEGEGEQHEQPGEGQQAVLHPIQQQSSSSSSQSAAVQSAAYSSSSSADVPVLPAQAEARQLCVGGVVREGLSEATGATTAAMELEGAVASASQGFGHRSEPSMECCASPLPGAMHVPGGSGSTGSARSSSSAESHALVEGRSASTAASASSSPRPPSTSLVTAVTTCPSPSSAMVSASPRAVIASAELLAEFQCPICFDLLCRPCTIECGMVVCESCLARTLKHSYTHPSGNRACPVLGAGCRWGPVRRMPGVQAVLHSHLRSLFPEEYERRLAEDRENTELVQLMRSASNNPSGTINRAQLLRRRGGAAGAAEADGAWRHNHQPAPPPPPPPQHHQQQHHHHHPAVAEFEAVLIRFRDDMEALAADPIRFPDVFADRQCLKMFLRHVLPALLTILALRAFPGHTPEGSDPAKLRSMSSTAFAQAYVVKGLGWWDVGLLMTCHSQPGFVYQVPPVIRTRLSSLKSVLVSRQLWPYERLLIASWMDYYHRVASTFYVISWSLSTLYLTTYCILNRVRRRRQEGVAWSRILLCELGLLAYLALCCELWNMFWWLLCRAKFGVWECAIDYRLTPANIIESSIISLILEVIFIVSLFMGAAVDPNDYLLLTATWLEQPEEWEKDLQVTVLSRFAFVYVPRRILSWF